MKTRTSFVANSSSSSFIIAYKRTVPEERCCPTCKRLYSEGNPYDIDIISYMEKNESKLDSDSYIEDGDISDNDYLDRITINNAKEIEDYKSKDFKIGKIHISYHDEVFNRGIESFKNTFIISSGGGW